MDHQSFQPNPPGSQPSKQLPVPERKHFLNKKFLVTFVILILLGTGAYGAIWYWQIQKGNTNIFCGGIAGVSCPSGYTCKLDGTYPDAGGTCVKN